VGSRSTPRDSRRHAGRTRLKQEFFKGAESVVRLKRDLGKGCVNAVGQPIRARWRSFGETARQPERGHVWRCT